MTADDFKRLYIANPAIPIMIMPLTGFTEVRHIGRHTLSSARGVRLCMPIDARQHLELQSYLIASGLVTM